MEKYTEDDLTFGLSKMLHEGNSEKAMLILKEIVRRNITIKISERENPLSSTCVFQLETELRMKWTILDKPTKLKMLSTIFNAEQNTLEILLDLSLPNYDEYLELAMGNNITKKNLQWFRIR